MHKCVCRCGWASGGVGGGPGLREAKHIHIGSELGTGMNKESQNDKRIAPKNQHICKQTINHFSFFFLLSSPDVEFMP
jgi:hypothetical protein